MRGFIIYALLRMVAAGNDNVWECPSTWPERCWIANPNLDWGSRSCDAAKLVVSDCWNCPFCPLQFRNVYGSTYNLVTGRSIDCLGFEPGAHMQPFPSTATSCDLFQYVCDKGYVMSDGGECVACESVIQTYDCGRGFFPKRCPRTTDVLGSPKEAFCDECVFPALPSDTVGGAPVYRYGVGNLYQDCFKSRQQMGFNISTCANYETPKWDKGWCLIECAAGFVPVVAAASSVIGSLPTCKRCETNCAPGTFPAACPGGALPFASQDGACMRCPVPLPENAVWVRECEWAPAVGYYTDGSGQCMPCSSGCDQDSTLFMMGCHDFSPGQCQSCASCGSASLYIRAEVHMDQCECVSCTAAVLGKSYYEQNCSEYADAVVKPCTSQCAAMSFASKQCSLHGDTQCAKCTPPQYGRLLQRPCLATSDAVYVKCPSGYACDGSERPYLCPADRQVTADGLCACLPGTTAASGGACVPLACSSGKYPDATINGCQSCTEADSVAALTVAGVMGIGACVCPPGYFVRRSSSNAGRIHCWPCGDMSCNPRVQRQTECLGLLGEEPACVCGVGPGMELLNVTFLTQDLCAVACMRGYSPYNAAASIAPALRDQYGFVAAKGPALVAASVAYAKAFAILDADLPMTMTLSEEENSSTLLWVTVAQKPAVAFPTNTVFISHYRSAILQIHHVLAHDAIAGWAWVVLRFQGFCEGYEGDEQGVCWAIHLIAVQPSASGGVLGSATCMPSIGMCVALKTGVDFTPTARVSSINSIAAGQQQSSLLVVWNDTRVTRYYLADSKQPKAELFEATSPVQSVAEGMDGVYVLFQSSGAVAVWNSRTALIAPVDFLQQPLRQLVAFPPGGHILVAQTNASLWVHVDLWNHYVSPPALLATTAAFQRNALAYTSNASSLLLVFQGNAQSCPVDTLSHYAAGACEAMQCTRSALACGPNSLRRAGASTCICQPGYYYQSGGCVPCSARSSVYCPGDSAPVACPDYAISVEPKTSIADCLCPPGMYHFESICLPCPVGFFCPLNGTHVPVPCSEGGATIEGRVWPLECVCPTRTHGLICEPCDDGDDCASAPISKTVAVLAIEGWATSAGERQLRECLTLLFPSSKYALYSIVGITSSFAALQSTPEQLYWSWLMLAESSLADDQQSIAGCLTNWFSGARVAIVARDTLSLRQAIPYGSRMEWDGNADNPSATCIAGYEDVAIVGSFGTQTHCFPCLNGTARARRAESRLCAPCSDPNAHAPYLGMSECKCVPGYAYSAQSNACELTTTSAFGQPWWVGGDVLQLSAAVASFGVLVIMFSAALVWCF